LDSRKKVDRQTLSKAGTIKRVTPESLKGKRVSGVNEKPRRKGGVVKEVWEPKLGRG